MSNRQWLYLVFAVILLALGACLVAEMYWHQRSGNPLVLVSQHQPVEAWRQIEARVPGNVALFRAINGTRYPLLDWLAAAMTCPGDIGVILPFVALLVWCFRRWKLRPLLLAFFIMFMVVHLVKMINLPRPITLLDDVYFIRHLSWGSFPSADSATAAMLAGVLYLRERRALQVLFWMLIPLFAWERMYLGVHFPLDCLVGIGIGLLSAWLGYRWDAFITRRQREIEAEDAPTSTADVTCPTASHE